jgi:GNAT superfamily N-acetyltransferase
MSKGSRHYTVAVFGAIMAIMTSMNSAMIAPSRLAFILSRGGMGIGKRLVNECVRFARHTSYKKITLLTSSMRDAARHIYQEAGFRLVEEEPHHSFGHDWVGQNWELKL